MAEVVPQQAVGRRGLLLILMLLLIGGAEAQIKYGLKAGLNFSTLSGASATSSLLIGYHAGVFEDVKITDKFVFQPEVLFSSQGVNRKLDVIGIDEPDRAVKYQVKIYYLNVALMMKYYVIRKLDLEAGPQIGLMLSAWNVMDGNKYALNSVQPIDWGANVGAGYDFTDHISVGVRYYYGLLNISKYRHDENVRNRVFGVSGMYRF